MPADSDLPATAVGYTSRPVTKVPDWHGLVVLDVLLNNLSTGLFLAMAVAELARPATFGPLTHAAYPLAFLLLLADLACLVADLGSPTRFHHMLRIFKPSSPMSLGTWCLTIYSLPLAVLALLAIWNPGPAYLWVQRSAAVAGLLPALGAAVYKGVLFSTSAQPGWKDARWLGGYFTSSALLLGCAQLLALSVLLGREPALAALRPAVCALVLVSAVSLGLLVLDVRATLRLAHAPGKLLRLAALVLGAGLAFPLALVVWGRPPALLAAALLIALAAFVVRAEIIDLPAAATGAHADEAG